MTKKEKKNMDTKNINNNMENEDNTMNNTGSDNNEKQKQDKHKKKTVSKKSKSSSKEKEYQEKINELNDKYLRLFSEFDNYRKRTAKEKLDLINNASAQMIEEILPVVDDFERAIETNEKVEGCDAIKEGMVHIYNKLTGILQKRGLKEIEATGKEFDTEYHEAITQIPAQTEDMKGKVIDVVQKGYTLNDKVIRYAKVVIGQ